ncbi:MAG: CotH kinase family protein [Deltaproteobacteria bacterium]|nr:CotH kinase family protein [Deltaproteobacteria bacterium]
MASPASGLNTIKIKMQDADFQKVIVGRGKKVEALAEISFNGGPFQKSEVESRGQSCLTAAKRPCLGIKTENKVQFLGANGLDGKTFNLASMWQDRGFVSSRLGFDMFRALGIFELKSEYVVVWINDLPYGMYLVTEKPKKAIARITDDAWIGRRGYKTRLETVEESKTISEKAAVSQFRSLYKDVANLLGEGLRASIESKLNLKRYMQWLIVNSVMMNGDYADEVFFYIDGKDPKRRFDIMPWDFDDLFKEPHAGPENQARADSIKSGILYGFENPLDVKIADDPLLARLLKEEAREILQKLTPAFVGGVIGQIQRDLVSYSREPEVLNSGLRDSYRKPYTEKFFVETTARRQAAILNRVELLKSRALSPD